MPIRSRWAAVAYRTAAAIVFAATVAVAALWVRSYRRSDCLSTVRFTDGITAADRYDRWSLWCLVSADGGVRLERERQELSILSSTLPMWFVAPGRTDGYSSADVATGTDAWATGPRTGQVTAVPVDWYHGGFALIEHRDRPASLYGVQGWHVRTPYWAWCAVGAITVGLLWHRGGRAGRAVTAGRCRRCRYDLRGTPDRCPECGTVVNG